MEECVYRAAAINNITLHHICSMKSNTWSLLILVGDFKKYFEFEGVFFVVFFKSGNCKHDPDVIRFAGGYLTTHPNPVAYLLPSYSLKHN